MRGIRKRTHWSIGAVIAGLVGMVIFAGTHISSKSNGPDATINSDTNGTTQVRRHSASDTGSGRGTRAKHQLAKLTIAPERGMGAYDRDQFGNGWQSQGSGCDTRAMVLKRQGKHVTTNDNCTVQSGTWTSLYDGKTVTDAQQLDADHMVPLASAWRAGAADWNAVKRERFANDYQHGEIVVVTAHSNRSKGDDAPPEYEPIANQRCSYATKWIKVKHRWQLTTTHHEHDALVRMLNTCS